MSDNLPEPALKGEYLLYQSADGRTRLSVRVGDATVWLPQGLIAALYQVSLKTVNDHLVDMDDERELTPGQLFGNSG